MYKKQAYPLKHQNWSFSSVISERKKIYIKAQFVKIQF